MLTFGEMGSERFLGTRLCGDEERAGTTEVTVAHYECTEPHGTNRFKAAGFVFYFDEKVNRAWRTQKTTRRLGRVVDCKS